MLSIKLIIEFDKFVENFMNDLKIHYYYGKVLGKFLGV